MFSNLTVFLLMGCTLWFPGAAESEHRRARPFEPAVVATFLTIGIAQRAKEQAGSQYQPNSGLGLFLRNGCGACHTIRGSEAHGTIGPDLSHIGSRRAIGAGILPNTDEAIAQFIARPDLVKPGVKMPAFDMLPQTDVQMIARYLKALQ